MAKSKQQVIWVELVYIGLFLSIALNWLIWSGKLLLLFQPTYRLRWGWPFISLVLIIIVFVFTFKLSQWLLYCLPYLSLSPIPRVLIKLPAYCFLILTTGLLIPLALVSLPILIVVNPQFHSLSVYSSPTGKYTIEATGDSDICTYRIYRNQFIVQRYIDQFSTRHESQNCDGMILQWSPDEREIRWWNSESRSQEHLKVSDVP